MSGEDDAGAAEDVGAVDDVDVAAEDLDTVADVDAEVLSLLDDRYARAVLVVTSDRARSADDLADRLGAARSTIYDRLSRLVDCELVVERQEIDADGHHHKTYRARLDRVVVDLAGDGFDVAVEREPTDPADRLTDAFEELRR